MREGATVTSRLQGLYLLEQIDTDLDELYEAHGDLPSEVAALYDARSELQARIDAASAVCHDAAARKISQAGEIEDLHEREKKFRAQQLNVRNNREYDAIVREIDSVGKRVIELRGQLKPLDETEVKFRSLLATLGGNMEELAEEIAEKEAEYQNVRKATNEEEGALLVRKNAILAQITSADLALYQRVRKARGGRAVTMIKRNSCTGCFHAIPHQKIVELRKQESVITCENCGRILVPELITS
jgi:predicted  nucleic acid-binding Zn-ribbon protein